MAPRFFVCPNCKHLKHCMTGLMYGSTSTFSKDILIFLGRVLPQKVIITVPVFMYSGYFCSSLLLLTRLLILLTPIMVFEDSVYFKIFSSESLGKIPLTTPLHEMELYNSST